MDSIEGTGSDTSPVKVIAGRLTETKDQNLTIQFNTTNGSGMNRQIFYDDTTRTVTYYNNSSTPNITGNGYSYFQLDDSASVDSKFDYGNGTLILDFATGLSNQSLVYTLNGKEDWKGNITGIFGATSRPGNTGNGGRHLNINLDKNYTGTIYMYQSTLGNSNDVFFKSNIKLGGANGSASTFTGELHLSAGGNTVDIKGNSSNYTFKGIMTLDGGTNIINLQKVDLYTKDGYNTTYNKNSAPIVMQGGTNTLNFTDSVNIYGQIYTTAGTNTFISNDSTKFYMAGDINAQGGNNIFVLKSTELTPVLAGNINVSRGRTTILFDNTAWLSASYKNSEDNALKTTYADKFLNLKDSGSGTVDPSNGKDKLSSLTGNLMVKDGGNADVIFRYSKEMTQGDKNITYNIQTANNNSGANIILDTTSLYSANGSSSPLIFNTNLTYGGYYDGTNQYVWIGSGNNNAINLFFAQGVSGSQSNTATVWGNDTKVEQKFLGQTYTNGIRLRFNDKNISVKGSSNVSFIAAYKDAILAKVNKDSHKTDLLSVKFETGKETKSNNHINTITLTGVAVGNVYALKPLDNMNNDAKVSTYNLILDSNSVLFGGLDFSALAQDSSIPNVETDTKNNIKFNFQLKEGSKLISNSSTNINKLEIQNATIHKDQLTQDIFTQDNTIIDIGSSGNAVDSIARRQNFNLLQIGTITNNGVPNPNSTTEGLKGENALFRVYVNTTANQGSAGGGNAGANLSNINGVTANGGKGSYGYLYSDRIIVHHLLAANGVSDKKADTPLTEYIQVLTDPDNDVTGVKYHGGGSEVEGNVAVLTVKNLDNGQAGINLQSTSAIAGFDELSSTLTTASTDKYGKSTSPNGYTTYFLSSLVSGITKEDASASMSALSSGYNTFIANLNSINKRMGELRDNANGNGLWARITNGMQSNYNHQNTSTIYTNIQAGFDHAFGSNGANDYVGFALSYINGVSFSKDMTRKDGSLAGLDSGISNGIELAFYNSYVNDGARSNRWDKGFYNDNVLKFTALFNSTNMLNGTSDSYSNFGVSFSEEIGYRFLLGKNNTWYIDPQAEVAIGYLTGSQVNQVSGNYHLNGNLDSIFVVRSRVGSSFGYYFDQFTQNKNFKSKLYVGLFYEGDYINGGSIALSSNLSKLNYALSSTSRMVLNIGTNFTIKDNHRIYFDFQRSFFGNIVTDYQLNLGYRYSFGTSKYTPLENINTAEASNDSKIKEVAPTPGYYIKLLTSNKPSKKENRILSQIDGLKTQDNGNAKTYMVGPFKDPETAKSAMVNYQGVSKELNTQAQVIEVE